MKRVIGIILAVMMAAAMLPSVVWADEAEFSDMAGNEYYAKAAQALNEKGILTGYGDGSFKAGNLITRAEMAAVICRAIGAEKSAPEAGEKIFNDVSPEHWALGYINAAAQRGIIGGDENGNFHPDDNVKYEEAVKMTVCAAGYGAEIVPDASDWAKPYLEAAEKHGITLGLSAGRGMAVTRGDAAVMLYGAIDPEKANEDRAIMTVSPLSSNVIEPSYMWHPGYSFTVTYTGDVESISLKPEDIVCKGMANYVNIEGEGNQRIVTILEGGSDLDILNPDDEIRAYIKDGTARSSSGTLANGGCTERMTIARETVKSKREHWEEAISGQCGDNVFWSLGNDGVLTISGTGPMWDLAYSSDVTWAVALCYVNNEFAELGLDKYYNSEYGICNFDNVDDEEYKRIEENINTLTKKYPIIDNGVDINKVVIKSGVTRIGNNFLETNAGMTVCQEYIKEVIIEEGLQEIGNDFMSGQYGTTVYIPKSVKKKKKKIGDNFAIPYYGIWDSNRVRIVGYSGSYAEQYAKEHNRNDDKEIDFFTVNESTGGLTVKKTEAEIYINGQRISNDVKHPFIDINGVTYFPVTEQNCRLAGYEIKNTISTFNNWAWIMRSVVWDDWREEIITLIPTDKEAEYESEEGDCGALFAEPALYTTVNIKKTEDDWDYFFGGMNISCNGVIYVPLNETKEDENPRPWKVTYGEGTVSIETNAE